MHSKYSAHRMTFRLAAVVALSLAGCGPRVDLGPLPNTRAADEIRKVFGASAEGGAADAAAAATGTGWATLKGRFVFDGTRTDDAALQRHQGPGHLHDRRQAAVAGNAAGRQRLGRHSRTW